MMTIGRCSLAYLKISSSGIPSRKMQLYLTLGNSPDVTFSFTGELAGFKALYEEGESVIRLQLQRPTYGWNQEFVLPVQM